MTDRELLDKAVQLQTDLKIAMKAILLRNARLDGYDYHDSEVVGMSQLLEGMLFGVDCVIGQFASKVFFDNRGK